MGSADVRGSVKKTCKFLPILQEIERKMKIFYLFTSLLLALMTVSCATTQVATPVESSHTREEKSSRVDSIYVRDSILIYIKGDTIRETRYRDVWRDRIVCDTVLQCDTIPQIVTVEVEKKLTFWQGVKQETWLFFVICTLVSVVIYIIRRFLRTL